MAQLREKRGGRDGGGGSTAAGAATTRGGGSQQPADRDKVDGDTGNNRSVAATTIGGPPRQRGDAEDRAVRPLPMGATALREGSGHDGSEGHPRRRGDRPQRGVTKTKKSCRHETRATPTTEGRWQRSSSGRGGCGNDGEGPSRQAVGSDKERRQEGRQDHGGERGASRTGASGGGGDKKGETPPTGGRRLHRMSGVEGKWWNAARGSGKRRSIGDEETRKATLGL